MLNRQQPFRLIASIRSPFARRIRVVLSRLQIPVEEQMIEVFSPPHDFAINNPLGLVPALYHPDWGWVSDSGALLEMLEEEWGGVWPASNHRRDVRQASVWAVGVMQSTVLYFQETALHEFPNERWTQDHLASVQDTLRALNTISPEIFYFQSKWTQAAWDCVIALDYCTFRIPEWKWEEELLQLAKMYGQFQDDPLFQRTRPVAI